MQLAKYKQIVIKFTPVALAACNKGSATPRRSFRLVNAFGAERIAWGSNTRLRPAICPT